MISSFSLLKFTPLTPSPTLINYSYERAEGGLCGGLCFIRKNKPNLIAVEREQWEVFQNINLLRQPFLEPPCLLSPLWLQ